jgi:hypothetical protein
LRKSYRKVSERTSIIALETASNTASETFQQQLQK